MLPIVKFLSKYKRVVFGDACGHTSLSVRPWKSSLAMFRAAKFVLPRRTLTAGFSEIVALKGTPEYLSSRLPLSKIVATIGPASENLPALAHVVNAGLRIMRINFSHAVSYALCTIACVCNMFCNCMVGT
jgi:hypothetical protein